MMRLATSWSYGPSTLRQLLSFGAVGIVINAATYAVYLVLTELSVEPKAAMTIAFAISVASTFGLNRRWTFRHSGRASRSAARYCGLYLAAYLGNLAALALLVDVANLPHRIVMLSLIVATACLMFVAQRAWVFSSP